MRRPHAIISMAPTFWARNCASRLRAGKRAEAVSAVDAEDAVAEVFEGTDIAAIGVLEGREAVGRGVAASIATAAAVVVKAEEVVVAAEGLVETSTGAVTDIHEMDTQVAAAMAVENLKIIHDSDQDRRMQAVRQDTKLLHTFFI